jgi:tRNA pseudouridine32 synthase/23S rRNA pseudouridine746 synthase
MKHDMFSGRIVLEDTLGSSGVACDLLARRTGLSKGRIKDAMNKGALRLKKAGKGSVQRLRRATADLGRGDWISFHYDESLLAIKPLVPGLVADEGAWSVWYKPAGLLSQGNEFGDHCSLLRQAELLLEPRREAFLVHRLDGPATGLMMVAHDRDLSGRLSALFAERKVYKRYRVMVAGSLAEDGSTRRLDEALDGKEAVSHATVISTQGGQQMLDVVIDTGRRHQIRRHLAAAGVPVVGDREYGGPAAPMLCLTCVELSFPDPRGSGEARYVIRDADVEWLGLTD